MKTERFLCPHVGCAMVAEVKAPHGKTEVYLAKLEVRRHRMKVHKDHRALHEGAMPTWEYLDNVE